MAQQLIARLRSHPLHTIESRYRLRLAATIAMMCNTKTVRLITQMLYQTQRLGVFIDIERRTISREIDFFQTLGNTDDGNLAPQAQLFQRREGRTQLPLATIYHDKLRQRLPLLYQTVVTAIDNLSHRGEVVGPLDGLDIEMPIIFFRRLRHLENHTRCDRIGSLDIGIIETLDMYRQLAEAEILLQARQYAGSALLGVELLRLFQTVYLILSHILLRYVEQLAFVATLGNQKMQLLKFGLGCKRYNSFARITAETRTQLRNSKSQNLGSRLIEFFLILDGDTLHDGTGLHVHIIDKGERFILFVGKYIHIVYRCTHNDRLCLITLYQIIPQLHLLSLFKPQLGRQLLHLLQQEVAQLLRIAI